MEETLRACLSLGRRVGFDEAHAVHDARIALRLFDLLSDLHRLPDEGRTILHYAALLHDLGTAEGYERHHKTSYRLILECGLPGLTKRQQLLVANVARYHRGARPKAAHSGLAMLAEDDRAMVALLGAILRVADGLDRSHCGAVERVDVRWEGDRLRILADCPWGCEAEVWAGQKKGRLLGDLLGVTVEVRERGGEAHG